MGGGALGAPPYFPTSPYGFMVGKLKFLSSKGLHVVKFFF
jgi:hypothetical protein